MRGGRRGFLAGCAGSLALAGTFPRHARAAQRPAVKIGVLTDLSGPFSSIAGRGSVACTKLAADDFARGGQPAFDVTVIAADHGNDMAKATGIASHWFDSEGVDLIVDVPNSDIALAIAGIAREKNRAYINCAAGTGRLTGSECSPNTIHWSFDTHMLARSTAGAVSQRGGSTWFFVTADYDFGHQMEDETQKFVQARGGRMIGDARYKFPGTSDFTPMLRQAQASGASVLGLANAGADLDACVRQARGLGINDEMRIAGLLMLLPDVHKLGLELAGGSLLTESFYWDLNDRTRAFTKRLMEQQKPPFYPDMIQAGCYAGTLHFLKAVADMGAANARSDAASVIAKMKATPTDDDAFGKGSIRRDGMAMFPAFLFQVKTDAESTGDWDYYTLLSTTPADEAYRSLAEGGCAIVKT